MPFIKSRLAKLEKASGVRITIEDYLKHYRESDTMSEKEVQRISTSRGYAKIVAFLNLSNSE